MTGLFMGSEYVYDVTSTSGLWFGGPLVTFLFGALRRAPERSFDAQKTPDLECTGGARVGQRKHVVAPNRSTDRLPPLVRLTRTPCSPGVTERVGRGPLGT